MDGCDLVSGLEESVRSEWNGDVDLDTGELQMLHSTYFDRLKRIASILTSCTHEILKVLKQERTDLFQEVLFISKGNSNA